MKKNNANSAETRSAEDRALDRFAEMMIEKIKTIQSDWKKPWITEGVQGWPVNLSGREYNGMNAFMLMMCCEEMNYKAPVFMTFDRVIGLNFKGGYRTNSTQLLDDEGKPLPHVGVKKGEKSFPVFITTFTVVDPETKEKIAYDDYKQLSQQDREKYNVYPKLNVYNVFNIDQTNIEEARPDLYKKVTAQYTQKPMEVITDDFAISAVDDMISESKWYCPIRPTYGDNAYYSISKDEIVVPEKKQFVDAESFYANLFHEMTHSTGAESRLNRLPAAGFGSAAYAREELVAELSAAMIATRFGITKHIKDDSAAYLKNWLQSLKESPEYIKTVLLDVKKASAMIIGRLEEIEDNIKIAV